MSDQCISFNEGGNYQLILKFSNLAVWISLPGIDKKYL